MSCSNLSSISIPKCSYIDGAAFRGCSKLTNSCVQNILNTYKSYSTVINSRVFEHCREGITSLNLTGYTSISSYAFNYCVNLSSISIPNCSYIGSTAFGACSKLASISFPNVEYIGSSAFNNCSSLKSISLPKCSYIGNGAFMRCSKLESVYVLSTSIPYLSFTGFSYTPLLVSSYLGRYGSIYVLSSMVAAFREAPGWRSYYGRITSYTGT